MLSTSGTLFCKGFVSGDTFAGLHSGTYTQIDVDLDIDIGRMFL